MDDVVAELRKDVFYGDERLHRMAEHNPLHLRAADEIENLRRRISRLEKGKDAMTFQMSVAFYNTDQTEKAAERYRTALTRILHDAPSLNWALDEARRALNEDNALTPDPESP